MSQFDEVNKREPDPEELIRLRALIKTDSETAFEGLEKLASRGSAWSMLYLADALRTGHEYRKDLDAAEYWYNVAAKHGLVHGRHGAGLVHFERGDYDKGIKELESCVAAGFSPSMNILGRMYYYGRGVKKDRGRARLLLEQAASLGHFYAKGLLARAFLKGNFGIRQIPHGIPILIQAAIDYVKATEQDPYTDRLR